MVLAPDRRHEGERGVVGGAPGRASRRAAIAWALLAALGCQSSYHDAYRSAHPGWVAALPRPTSELEEVLASLYAPVDVEGVQVTVAQLEIYRADVEPWRAISFERIRSGAERSDDAASYAVVVAWACRADEGLRVLAEERVGYYLLPGNRLEGFDHYTFGGGCRSRDQFRAVRGAAVALERELTARIARDHGRPALGLEQIYRRGIAFVEAGRSEEARAMLLAGEPAYRAARRRARQAPSSEASQALAEAGRLRGNLMRALGVEEADRGRPGARAPSGTLPLQLAQCLAGARLEHEQPTAQVEDHLDTRRVHTHVPHQHDRHAQILGLCRREFVVREEPLLAQAVEQTPVVEPKVPQHVLYARTLAHEKSSLRRSGGS